MNIEKGGWGAEWLSKKKKTNINFCPVSSGMPTNTWAASAQDFSRS